MEIKPLDPQTIAEWTPLMEYVAGAVMCYWLLKLLVMVIMDFRR
jgi:hypothetical protein